MQLLSHRVLCPTVTQTPSNGAAEATDLGVPVTVGLPQEILDLMKLYPAPVQQSAVEFLPFDPPGKRLN